MKFLKIKLKLLVLLFLSIPASATQDAELHDALISVMQQHNIPDLSVGIIRAGKSEYAADLHRNSDGTVKVDSGSTLFRVASITKIFTTQAIMQLVEKGKISLDDKVSLYVPEFKKSGMTIRHLLTHYGGLQDKVWPEPFSLNSNFDHYLSKVLVVNPDIKAGAKFQYSDTGFNILGNIIARVSGLSYSTYIERHILQPSGMFASGYYSGANGLSPSVEPYKNGQLIPQDQRWPFDPQFFPSEGLITNVNDLNHWIKMVLTMDIKLLTKTSYQQMLVPRAATSWDETRISLGWFMVKRNGIEYTYHMGAIRGYESIVAIDFKTNNAVILLANSSNVPRWEMVDLIEGVMKKDNFLPKK